MSLFIEKRKAFEAKRKGHYREWEAVQLARKKLLEEGDEEDEDEDNADDKNKNTETEEDEETETEGEKEEDERQEKTLNKCVPLTENQIESG